MKYLLLAALLYSPDKSELLGNQLAIKADCQRIEHELPVYKCGEHHDFDIFKLYFASFVRGYSDITQILSWTKSGNDGYGTVIEHDDQQYLIVFNDISNVFIIKNATEVE